MKKIIRITIVAVLCLLVFNSIYQKDQEMVRVGVLAPFSDGLTVFGERIRNGMELARSDLITDGTINDFKIIYEDVCDPASAISGVQKLILQDKVDFFGASFCLLGTDATENLIEENNTFIFNVAANPETTLNKGHIFSTNFSIEKDSKKISDYIKEELKAERIAIIYFDSSFGESYYQNILKEFSGPNHEIVFAQAKGFGVNDFRTEVTKIKQVDPDALVYIHFGSPLGNLIRQTREIGMNLPIVGHYEEEDPTVIEFAQGAAEGMIISSSQPEVKTANVKAFEQKYFERFGEMPDVLAANAYDSLRLQVESYVACNQDIECTKEKLESVTNYDGVSGRITIDPETHAVEKPNIFKVVKDGEFVELK